MTKKPFIWAPNQREEGKEKGGKKKRKEKKMILRPKGSAP